MEILYFLMPLGAGAILYSVIVTFVKAPGRALQKKFINLGILKGKTLSEITTVCGNPNSISSGKDGVKVYQWLATGYHIVLLFDENNICLGVSSETKV